MVFNKLFKVTIDSLSIENIIIAIVVRNYGLLDSIIIN